MYCQTPSEAELTAFGFAPTDFEDVIDVWPDNFNAFVVFQTMRTQWRIGMGQCTGLDYSALPEVWRRLKIPIKDRDEVFQQVRIMEEAALEEMYSARKK